VVQTLRDPGPAACAQRSGSITPTSEPCTTWDLERAPATSSSRPSPARRSRNGSGRSSLPLDEILEVATGVAAGLEALHRAGLVHGNLDPAKILLSEGPPKLVDYGLGRTSAPSSPPRPEGPSLRRKNLGPGFGYLSPEEDRGAAADARSDVFALGAILDELISGPLPFAHEAARVLRSLREVVARCLAVDPAARYPSGSELREGPRTTSVLEKRRLESALRAHAAARRRRIAAGWMVVAGLGLLAFVERFRSRAKTGAPRPEPAAGILTPPRVASSDMDEDPPPAVDRASEGQPETSRGTGVGRGDPAAILHAQGARRAISPAIHSATTRFPSGE
jgi:hypothetical protein